MNALRWLTAAALVSLMACSNGNGDPAEEVANVIAAGESSATQSGNGSSESEAVGDAEGNSEADSDGEGQAEPEDARPGTEPGAPVTPPVSGGGTSGGAAPPADDSGARPPAPSTDSPSSSPADGGNDDSGTSTPTTPADGSGGDSGPIDTSPPAQDPGPEPEPPSGPISVVVPDDPVSEPIMAEPPSSEPISAPPPNNLDIIVPGQINQVRLLSATSEEMGTLSVSSHTLPWGLTNAREAYQSTHYLARTNQEPSAGSIKIPMRTYTAHCTNPTGVDSVFVSMTLQDGDSINDNVGTVFEMQYSDSTGGFERVDNQVKLSGLCNQTHGIAVSSNCSTVAVLCQTDPLASQSLSFDKDLVEEYGDTRMKNDADNFDEIGTSIGGKANPEVWLLEWDNTPLSGHHSSYVATKQAGGYGGKSALTLRYVENDSQGRSSYSFATTTRVFDGGGGSHNSGALFVIDRDNWKYDMHDADGGRGWSFDCVAGHILHMRAIYNPYTEMYSAVCTSDLSSTSGSNNWGFSLGTVGVKNEDRRAGYKGSTSYFVPSRNSAVTNGGAHTVLPVSATRSLMLLVAPQLAPTSTFKNFVQYVDDNSRGDQAGLPDDEVCGLWGDYTGGCFLNFVSWRADEGNSTTYPTRANWVHLAGRHTLDPEFYSRVGILPLNADNSRINGTGPIWLTGHAWDLDDEDNVTYGGTIVGDGTNGTVVGCTYGAPQLVDLKNGRYLLGYGKFVCSDHGYSKNRHGQRADRVRGGADVLIPQAYYLMEIDADGNVLEGPIELTSDALGDFGWGGIDELISMGRGKVGWWYTSEPTKLPEVDTALPSPRTTEWRFIVYESAEP